VFLAPSNPDWQWFGSLSSDKETAQKVKDNPNVEWLQKANTWITRTAQHVLCGPPQHYVPVLTVNNSNGRLGFLIIDEKITYGNTASSEYNEFESHAYNAAKLIFDLFKPFQHNLGEPLVDIYLDQTGGGSSLSLPAMIAALQRLTGICLPDTVVSTGCFCLTKGKLLSVDSNTLSLKIDTAKRFGYKKIILVEGQTGIRKIAV
jgi:hypothetical protein